MKKTKKLLAAMVSFAMLLNSAGGLTLAAAESTGSYTAEVTADGWTQVTQENGPTLGYFEGSGVTLLEVDGYVFKDLDKDGELDPYEDWRLDASERAADLAAKLPMESVFGLMFHTSLFTYEQDGSDIYGMDGVTNIETMMDQGIRSALNFMISMRLPPANTLVSINNNAQKYAEALDYGIPFNFSTNPASISGGVDHLPLAATFDPELVKTYYQDKAKQYKAIGISTVLGPQIDIASEPRWWRSSSTFGEDPALATDMAEAEISALQSTYDADGNDLGWGEDSVIAMMKHWPGDGSAESGRESHSASGAYTVYPGDGFETQLIPFVDGGLSLASATGQVASVMTSYSIAFSDSLEYGELVGSAYSDYKINLLREDLGYDGLIVTDWGILESTGWGVEDLTLAERIAKAVIAGVDEFGTSEALYDEEAFAEAYVLVEESLGEEGAEAQFRNTARRTLTTFFLVGLFENPYRSAQAALDAVNNENSAAIAYETQVRSIVMLKNENGAIAPADGTKETVYVPYHVNKDGEPELFTDLTTLSQYYDVVTDALGEPTGENGAYTADDIIRATPEELANCTKAIVYVNNPSNAGSDSADGGYGYDPETDSYFPISLQYGEYVADSSSVRSESISGKTVVVETATPYGIVKSYETETHSYYGEAARITNASELDGILYAAENLPEEAQIIVCISADRPMIVSEFEDKVDAIVIGFGGNGRDAVKPAAYLDIVSGKVEPSGLLPIQMPADMETVEAQQEDVPRDMECYVDTAGNTYDFTFGLNWSGVIQDERVETYNVPVQLELLSTSY